MRQVIPALVATLAAQLLITMSVGTGPVLAPLAAPDIGVSAELVGAYISIVYGMAAIAGLICGSFVSRLGALRMTQISLIVVAIGLGVGTWGLPLATVASAALLGIANGPTTPSSSHILARVTPPEWRNAVFSTKQMGVPLGNGLAGLLMPVLALSFGWRAAALTGAAMCATLAVAVQPWRGSLDVGQDAGSRLFSTALVTGPLRIVFRTPALRQLSLVSFVYSGMQTCFTAFLVTYLHDRLAMSLVLAGLVMTISQTTGAIGRLVWGTLTDRLLDPIFLLGMLGFGMSVCALFTAGFTQDWPFWAIVAVGMGFGATTSAWNGVFLAQVAMLAPAGKVSEATGGSQFCTFGGVTLIPALFSLVLRTTGSYAIGFVTLAAMTSLAGLWLFRTAAARRATSVG